MHTKDGLKNELSLTDGGPKELEAMELYLSSSIKSISQVPDDSAAGWPGKGNAHTCYRIQNQMRKQAI